MKNYNFSVSNKSAHTNCTFPVAVVVNSGDSNGYGTIVNLGRMGIPVLSLDSNPENVTFFSRYAKKVLCPDYLISEEKYIEFLVNFGSQFYKKPVLYISGDLQLIATLKHKARLESYFYIPTTSLDVVEKLVDKVQFYKMLKKYNIPHAPTFFPETISEVEKFSPDLDYPYIIKPVQSTTFLKQFGTKCIKARFPQELIEVYRKAETGDDRLIVQKEIAGSDRYLVYTYMDQESTPLAVTCCKKIRIQPIDYGNACVCKTVWEPEAVKLCIELLEKIGYSGLAEAEIQKDENDGQFKLVEINARSTTENRLSAKCGLNMEYIAYNDMIGKVTKTIPQGDKNIVWVDIIRDILTVFSPGGYLSEKKITISQWIGSLKGTREYAFFFWRDPLPFIILFFRFIKMYGFKSKRLFFFKRG